MINNKNILPKNFKKSDTKIFSNLDKKVIKFRITHRKNLILTGKEGFLFKFIILQRHCFPNWEYFNFFKYSHWTLFKRFFYGLFFYPTQAKSLFRPTACLSGENLVLGADIWGGNYFHWFSDSLPKISNFIEASKDSKPLIILPKNCDKEFIKKSLEKLKLEFKILDSNKNYFVPKIRIPSNSAETGYFDDKFIDIQAFFRKEFFNFKKENETCVYISRKKARCRRVHNEHDVIVKLKELGFIDIVLEDISWEEQIKIIYNAKILVGMHGAGLTNMLFMRKGSIILEFKISDCHFYNNCYLNMANSLGHHYYYQIGQNMYVSKDLGNDDVYINLKNLEDLVRDIV